MNKFAAIILLIIILSALFGLKINRYSPLDIFPDDSYKPPCASHIMGTDNQGRDVLSRVIYGTRISLEIGIIATIMSLLIGLFFGLTAGYLGGMIDKIICMIIDLTLSFPSLLLAIGIAVILPSGVVTIILVLVIVGWAGFARFTRSIVLELRSCGYVEAAKVLGLNSSGIISRHILPNCMPLLVVTGSLKLGTFILAESGLSFLGLGVPPPVPTLGGMINYGRDFISIAPWVIIFPGIILAVIVLCCNILGDGLRDWLDPKKKLRED